MWQIKLSKVLHLLLPKRGDITLPDAALSQMIEKLISMQGR